MLSSTRKKYVKILTRLRLTFFSLVWASSSSASLLTSKSSSKRAVCLNLKVKMKVNNLNGGSRHSTVDQFVQIIEF